MIKNNNQYQLTQERANQFRQTLHSLPSNAQRGDLVKIQRDALASQIADLEGELRTYEDLKSGHFQLGTPETFMALRMALIQARIAQDLSYKELADRTGLQEQEIQHYEETDYSSANFSQIKKVASELGVKTALLETTHNAALEEVVQRLASIGLDSQFIVKRLISRHLTSMLTSRDEPGMQSALVYEAAAEISRVFGWCITDVLNVKGETLTPILPEVRFKAPASARSCQVNAYAAYARYLSLIVADACTHLPQARIPTEPSVLRHSVIDRYGSFTLHALVGYIWELGVPVLSLDGPGEFHGACFRENGRNIIVLKQRSTSESRWIFDLLHELWHAAQEPSRLERTVVELEYGAISEEDHGFTEEKEAGQFAGAVLLKGQGQNWWGTAANMQPRADPWSVVREVLFDKFDFSRLPELEREFLARAVSPWEIT